MADHPQYLRHKQNGGIYRWTVALDSRWRVDGDFEPFDPEKDHAPEGTYSEVSEDPRAGEPESAGAGEAGPASGGEPEVEAAPERPLKDLHWTALRKLVIDKGGVYTTKAAALKFLEAE
jgi:hypothetical protein